MDNNQGKSSPLGSVITEIIIAAVLVILILGTLNYFSILPLSQSFPFLSFLPQQSGITQLQKTEQSVSSSSGSGTISILPNLRAVVQAVEPQKITNSSASASYKFLPKSGIKISGPLRIDMEVGAVTNSVKASDSDGLMFNNGLKYENKDFRLLRVFYYPKDKNWAIETRANNKSQYSFLAKAPKGTNFLKITLLISSDGKSITVLTPGAKSKTIPFSDSLYAAGKQMNIATQVAPNSELDIYSLYYQY
jgi:hypothetical protein